MPHIFGVFPVRFALMLTVVVMYYVVAKQALFAASGRLASSLQIARRHSTSEITNFLELAVAGLSHISFLALLVLAIGLTPRSLGLVAFKPWRIAYGVALGVTEMTLSSFLCFLAIKAAMLVRSRTVPSELKDWLTMARAGWMRHHLRTIEIAPLPLTGALILLQVGSEELVFRGVMINVFQPAGAALAVGASVVLFTLMQAFQMPTWYSAMFPMVGAFVMGIVHGVLFLLVPDILPLIVAHLSFLGFAVI